MSGSVLMLEDGRRRARARKGRRRARASTPECVFFVLKRAIATPSRLCACRRRRSKQRRHRHALDRLVAPRPAGPTLSARWGRGAGASTTTRTTAHPHHQSRTPKNAPRCAPSSRRRPPPAPRQAASTWLLRRRRGRSPGEGEARRERVARPAFVCVRARALLWFALRAGGKRGAPHVCGRSVCVCVCGSVSASAACVCLAQASGSRARLGGAARPPLARAPSRLGGCPAAAELLQTDEVADESRTTVVNTNDPAREIEGGT